MSTPLQAHRIETTLTQDGTLALDSLPFQAGETVEVIVLLKSAARPPGARYPLRGTVIEYHAPFESVAESDWEAN